MKYYKIITPSPNIFPQVECLTAFTAEAISPWRIHDCTDISLSFNLKKKAELTDVVTHMAGPSEDFLISKKMKDVVKVIWRGWWFFCFFYLLLTAPKLAWVCLGLHLIANKSLQ